MARRFHVRKFDIDIFKQSSACFCKFLVMILKLFVATLAAGC